MALVHCNFFSETLGMASSMDVILPESASGQIGMKGLSSQRESKCLYLLHGLTDDHTIWQRRTSIERYVASLGLAVVMPNCHRSFYTDMVHGYKYWTYVSEEIPARAREFFRISGAREDNFVAGLSMGGYGAFKLALRCPEGFCAGASLSGAVDISDRVEKGNWKDDARLIFGDVDNVDGQPEDLFACVDSLLESGAPRPKLYQCCGTEDVLYEDNLKFRDFALERGLDLTYDDGPGQHEWGYWDMQIQKVLSWLRPCLQASS